MSSPSEMANSNGKPAKDPSIQELGQQFDLDTDRFNAPSTDRGH